MINALIDIGFVVLILGFFAATVGLVRFCASLLGSKGDPS
jgi:hypothetical protein